MGDLTTVAGPAVVTACAATGRAAVFVAPDAPFEIRSYPLPPPPPGAALVRVTMATICGSDIHSSKAAGRARAPASWGTRS